MERFPLRQYNRCLHPPWREKFDLSASFFVEAYSYTELVSSSDGGHALGGAGASQTVAQPRLKWTLEPGGKELVPTIQCDTGYCFLP